MPYLVVLVGEVSAVDPLLFLKSKVALLEIRSSLANGLD